MNSGDGEAWVRGKGKTPLRSIGQGNDLENRYSTLLSMTPARTPGTRKGEDNPHKQMGDEDGETEPDGPEAGIRYGINRGKKAGIKRPDNPRPTPICGDKRLNEWFHDGGKRKDGTGERQLKSDQVNAQERSLIG